MYFFLRTILLLLFFSKTLFGSKELTQIRFQPDWFLNGQFAGFFAAKAEGYYQDKNLELQIETFDFGHPFIENVATNEAQFGTAEAYILMDAIAQGKPLVILGAVLSQSPAGYIYLEKSGIRSAQDLAGKCIGTHAYSEALLPYFLKKAGIAPTSVTEVSVKHDMHVLLNSSVDLHQGYAIDEMLRLQRMTDEPVNILTFEQLGLPMYAMVIYTNRTFAQEHPSIVQDFLKASQEGWQYALQNPKKAAHLLIANQSNPPDSHAYLTEQIKAMRPFMPQARASLLSMQRSQWETMYRSFLESGLIQKPIGLDSILHRELSLLHE